MVNLGNMESMSKNFATLRVFEQHFYVIKKVESIVKRIKR